MISSYSWVYSGVQVDIDISNESDKYRLAVGGYSGDAVGFRYW